MKWTRDSFGNYESDCKRFLISKTRCAFVLHDKNGWVETYRSLADAKSIANQIGKPFKIGSSHSLS
jgi:hypothetical protein